LWWWIWTSFCIWHTSATLTAHINHHWCLCLGFILIIVCIASHLNWIWSESNLPSTYLHKMRSDK
jgi:hypothetical protein